MINYKVLNVCFSDSDCGLIKMATLDVANTIMSYTDLDYGYISDDFNKSRERWINEFVDEKYKESFLKSYNENFNRIIKFAKKGNVIRIWVSDNPTSLCGFYHLVNSLKERNCKMIMIKQPEEEGYSYNYWSLNDWNYIKKCLVLEKELSKEQIEYYSNEWIRLVNENTKLRIMLDGRIVSVEEDYFDEIIYNLSPEGEFSIHKLEIGRAHV